MTSASLRRSGTWESPRAIVLFLHGGQQANTEPVLERHASWWRIARMQDRFEPFAREHDLAVALLKYRFRGWNAGPGRTPDPVVDARGALEELRGEHPGVPVVLVGHSMGGRTACHVADDPAVAGVVGLAPWLPEGEPTGALRERHLTVAHGSRDRWTSPRWSRVYVERCQGLATSATWTSMGPVGHFMLRRAGRWNAFTRDGVDAVLGLTRDLGPGVDA
ncbi:alpha/beta hydrolase [Solicola sp. PLA-1-18]|uniref:alpha/beta hydrolase n=1 Tax=Solicola sp. PLA-1-18 TaxID=3380532 RepID=UPI003B7EFAF0